MEDTPFTRQRSYYLREVKRDGRPSKMGAAEYERLCQEQNGVCAICGLPETSTKSSRLSIDHSHETGRIRGLLCNNCNTALGLFHESEEILENAIRYLRRGDREVDVLPVGNSSTRPAVMEFEGETYYSTEEACNYLGVNRNALNWLRRSGRLRRYRQGSTETPYYRQSELDALREPTWETPEKAKRLSRGSTRPAVMEFEGGTYYSTEEACNYLGVTRDTLNRMARDGRLHRCHRGFARTVYYRQSELDALKMMRQVGG